MLGGGGGGRWWCLHNSNEGEHWDTDSGRSATVGAAIDDSAGRGYSGREDNVSGGNISNEGEGEGGVMVEEEKVNIVTHLSHNLSIHCAFVNGFLKAIMLCNSPQSR